MSSVADKFTAEEIEEFRQLFTQYDADHTGDIDSGELGEMLTELGVDCTQEECDELMRAIDKDGNANPTIDFDEFLLMMWRYRNGGESDEEDEHVSAPTQQQKDAQGAAGALEPENVALIDTMTTEELSSKLEMFLNMKDSLRDAFSGTAAEGGNGGGGEPEEASPPSPIVKKTAATAGGGATASPAAKPKADPERVRRESAYQHTVHFVIDSLLENNFVFSHETKPSKKETAESLAKSMMHTLGLLTDYVQQRLSLAVDYVEVGVGGFEDDADHQRSQLEPVDETSVALDLDELKDYAFDDSTGHGQKQGGEAFRQKARDFPFFMFPIETICEQLDLVDQRYNQYVHHIGLNEFLLRPRCPDGRHCKLQDNPDHRLAATHPCYADEVPCPHSNRAMHMKCYFHGDEAENVTKESALKEIARLLGVLDITGFEIGDCGGQCLAQVLLQDALLPKDERKYRELKAAGNHFSPTGAVPILDACAELVKLDLSSNGLGYRGSLLFPGGGVGPSLHQLLTRSEKLTHLCLARNRLSDNEMRFIADALKYNSVLKHLDLRKNEFGPACGEMLAQAMADNRYLSELLLGWNRLEASGSYELLNELQSSSTVEVLDLSWAGVSDEGGKCIARMIAGSTSLLSIDVSHNTIGKVSAPLISKALQQNKTMVFFDISYNPLGDRGTTEIIKDMRENFVLECLDLRCTKARDEAHKEIQQTLRIREPKMRDVQQKILFEREIAGD